MALNLLTGQEVNLTKLQVKWKNMCIKLPIAIPIAIILWKLMLSSKGNNCPRNVSLNIVNVLLQTGMRIKAMLILSVSAAPFAIQTQ